MFHHAYNFNYFEERLSALKSLLEKDADRFLGEDLRSLFWMFRRSGGEKEALLRELILICESKTTLSADVQIFVDEWCTNLFLEAGIGGANSCRLLLQAAYARFERSDFWNSIAERFELKEDQIREAVEPEQLFDWLILWMFHNYPNALLFLMKDDLLKPYRALAKIDLQQLVQYLPRFIFWGIRSMLQKKQNRHLVQKLAEGRNIRGIKSTPAVFTKRMAHWFVLAPKEYDLVSATWFAIFKGLEADIDLLPAFKNHFHNRFGDMDFLQNLIFFFDRCSHRLGAEEMSQLLGYLQHLQDENGPIDIKGWTLGSLRRRARQWYEELELIRMVRMENLSAYQWNGASYKPYEEEGENCVYRIEQLTTAKALSKEGRRMKHCVGSYAARCSNGISSIWSLRRIDAFGYEPLVTIEVSRRGDIVQARGKQNATPSGSVIGMIRRWARKEGLRYR